MGVHELEIVVSKMKEHGFQSWLSRNAKTSRTTIAEIFAGRRQSTPKQAADLERLFIQKGIPIDRWDLLYGYKASRTAPLRLIDVVMHKMGKANAPNNTDNPSE